MDEPTFPSIKLLDLQREHAPLEHEIKARIAEVLRSGIFVLGPWLERFEAETAEWLGTGHAVGVASGTDALWLALRALDIGPGDEVITTPYTFFANVEAIRRTGATPVFADIDPETWNLDPAAVETAITPATRAILPVHLFGLPADMPAMRQIAARHNLAIVEDCAQAMGARRNGRAAGTFGILGCFSFYPTKILGALGDGGMIVTTDAGLAARLRRLRNHGDKGGYEHLEEGWNSRLDEIQAAVLSLKLAHLHDTLQRRRTLAATYRECLSGTSLQLPAEPPHCEPVYAQYTVLAERRDQLALALRDRGIPTAVHYPRPTYRQQAGGRTPPLPVVERVTRRCLSLPLHPAMTEAEIRYVAQHVRECLESIS